MKTNKFSENAKNSFRSLRRVPGSMRKNLAERALQLLVSRLPAMWVVQTVAYRPYGLDALLEVADETDALNGQMAWVQLHVVRRLRWEADGCYVAGPIDKIPDDRCTVASGPVLMVLADVSRQGLYAISQDAFLQEHFHRYLAEGVLCWHFHQQQDALRPGSEVGCLRLLLRQWVEKRELEDIIILYLLQAEERGDLPPGMTTHLSSSIHRLLTTRLAYWSFTQPGMYYHLFACLRRVQGSI